MPLTSDSLSKIRAAFPSVSTTDTIYFDNPGGTQVTQSVIDAITEYYLHRNANVGAAFARSQKTDQTVAEARSAMADFLGTPDPETIVFGPSMTALTFHIARSFGETLLPGDEIIVTDLDHDANVTPWAELEAFGAVIRRIPFHTADGTLDREAYYAALRPGKTRLAALGYASNALGTVTDLAPLVAAAHEAGAQVYIDAVQSVPHIPTDVTTLDCDFLACSAYKFFGPHMGVLYGKRSHLENLTPHKVRPAKNYIPWRWEQGTPNFECLSAITAAVDYIASLGVGASRRERLLSAMSDVQAYEQALSARLLQGLQRVPGVTVFGITDPRRLQERIPTFSFVVKGETPRMTCERLARANVNSYNGNYYAVQVMESLGLSENGAVRVGLAHYNTSEEIDRFLVALAGETNQ